MDSNRVPWGRSKANIYNIQLSKFDIPMITILIVWFGILAVLYSNMTSRENYHYYKKIFLEADKIVFLGMGTPALYSHR